MLPETGERVMIRDPTTLALPMLSVSSTIRVYSKVRRYLNWDKYTNLTMRNVHCLPKKMKNGLMQTLLTPEMPF